MKLQKMIAPVLAASLIATMAGGAFAATTVKRSETGSPAQHQSQMLTKTSASTTATSGSALLKKTSAKAVEPSGAASGTSQGGQMQQQKSASNTSDGTTGTALHKKKT